MKIILISDIFGKTPALEQLCLELGNNIEIIDPYDAEFKNFENENEAYKYFNENIGLEKYSQHLKNVVSEQTQSVRLIGFSIGASVIWMNSDNESFANVQEAYCFYGSQIRKMTHLKPLFPIEMILPKNEAHFSVTELIGELEETTQVSISETTYLHGFMNKYSKNFNLQAYTHFIKQLR